MNTRPFGSDDEQDTHDIFREEDERERDPLHDNRSGEIHVNPLHPTPSAPLTRLFLNLFLGTYAAVGLVLPWLVMAAVWTEPGTSLGLRVFLLMQGVATLLVLALLGVYLVGLLRAFHCHTPGDVHALCCPWSSEHDDDQLRGVRVGQSLMDMWQQSGWKPDRLPSRFRLLWVAATASLVIHLLAYLEVAVIAIL